MPEAPLEFEDDPRIAADYVLYRRIPPGRAKETPAGIVRPNSDTLDFAPRHKAIEMGLPGPCMSLGSQLILQEKGLGPEAMLEDHEEYGLVSFRAIELRAVGLSLQVWPYPYAWHVVAFNTEWERIPKAARKALAESAVWVLEPP